MTTTDIKNKIQSTYWVFQIIIIIATIVLVVLIYPIRADINELNETLREVEKEKIPQIEADIVETQMQLREQVIINLHIRELLDDIRNDVKEVKEALNN